MRSMPTRSCQETLATNHREIHLSKPYPTALQTRFSDSSNRVNEWGMASNDSPRPGQSSPGLGFSDLRCLEIERLLLLQRRLEQA